MLNFKEFLQREEVDLKVIKSAPIAKIPTKTFRASGPGKMNPLGLVSPYSPRSISGKQSLIANRE